MLVGNGTVRDTVSLPSLSEHAFGALLMSVPLGVLIYALRRYLPALVKQLDHRYRPNWRRLRWMMPLASLACTLLFAELADRINIREDLAIIVIGALNPPSLIALLLLSGVLMGAPLPAWMIVAVALTAHWTIWYVLIRWLESLTREPSSTIFADWRE